MTVNIQYVHMATSEAMNEYVKQGLEKLGNKYEWLIGAQVHFKKENDPSGKGKICQMELSAPGPRIFAEANRDTFEGAAKEVLRELNKQLKKRKEIYKTH